MEPNANPNVPPVVEKNETNTAKDMEEMTTPASAMAQPEKKKNKTGMIVGIVCLALLAVAGLSFGAYAMITKDNAIADAEKRCNETCEDNTVVEVIENGGETTVTFTKANSDQEEVKNLLSKVYESLRNANFGVRFYNTYGDGTIIKVSDTIYTSSNESYGIESAYDDGNAAGLTEEMSKVMYNAYKYAEDALVANGFTVGPEFMWTRAYYNNSLDITCNVNEEELPFMIECGKNSWISNEAKELAITLAKAADTNFVSVAHGYEIKNSKVAPYQTMIAGGLNYAMLFYRTAPDAAWQYFTGTQAVLDCDEYTGDVAKAFAGEVCWDTEMNQESTVQPSEE